jgi:Rrf2 family protein
MKIPVKVDYGIRALVRLGLDPGRYHTIDQISTEESVPVSYVPSILLELSNHGYVEARRGARGGYKLAKPASRITLRDIFVHLAGDVITAECLLNPSRCDVYAECSLREIWKEASDALAEILESFTIADLVYRRMKQVKEGMYYI